MMKWTRAFLIGAIWWAEVANGFGGTPVPGPLRFQFREPRTAVYHVWPTPPVALLSLPPSPWLRAQRADGSRQTVELGDRVVVQLAGNQQLPALLAGSPLHQARAFSAQVFVLQAPDAWSALAEAQRLAQQPGVVAAYPVRRQAARLHNAYARQPNDPQFNQQWYLENRDAETGARIGADLNVRAAWPYARGQGVVIAVADDGVDLTHPELAPRAAAELNYDFNAGTTNGAPANRSATHGTEVAGLAAAEGNNQLGMIGVAYQARLASWVIFSDLDMLPSEERMADMFQYQSNAVSVQNHSWGNAGTLPLSPTLLESIAISNAVTYGRNGLGVIMVRSGGNGRLDRLDANDDGYLADARVVPVAAVRSDGRVASYSNPGANLLLAAPSGDPSNGFPTVFTTALAAAAPTIQNPNPEDLSAYAFGPLGFSGTSASAPQIAGVAALILSANPGLSYRDVQQVLILSARHLDLTDPDLTTNGAGFRVSHNVGFGVPDAGTAVALAKFWKNRPATATLTFTQTNLQAIPDAGFHLLLSGEGVPDNLTRLLAVPSEGPYPDVPTALYPLVDVGSATDALATNLTGQAALIQRGTNYFSDKITKAAQAGAAFAIIYNNRDETQLVHMAQTDYTPIPAAFISQHDGEAIGSWLAQGKPLQARLRLDAAHYEFAVTNTLLLESVAVRVMTDHQRRGDVRITLLSPQGTRSVLQHSNNDDTPGPLDWTYYSTHHYYESSAGVWQVALSDEMLGNTGSVQSVSLILAGVPIKDRDHDGMDDDWELAHFGTLSYGPQDDPYHRGYSLARQQIIGTDLSLNQTAVRLDLAVWNNRLLRLSWPGAPDRSYEVLRRGLGQSLATITNVPGNFPQTEWFTPYTNAPHQSFELRVPASR